MNIDIVNDEILLVGIENTITIKDFANAILERDGHLYVSFLDGTGKTYSDIHVQPQTYPTNCTNIKYMMSETQIIIISSKDVIGCEYYNMSDKDVKESFLDENSMSLYIPKEHDVLILKFKTCKLIYNGDPIDCLTVSKLISRRMDPGVFRKMALHFKDD